MSDRYAARTDVSLERSRTEIERLLVRYGATAFQYGWEGELSAISFKIQDRYVRILLPMPSRDDPTVTRSETGKRRSTTAAGNAYDQAVRQRWRALKLIVQAKLEAVASGITTIEREFMADVVLADGRTFGQWAAPQLQAMYDSGKMPPLLPGPMEENPE